MRNRITILLCYLFSACWSTACPRADYQTIIGGEEFSVEKIAFASNTAGDMLVGGIVEMYDSEEVLFMTSFLYLLKTDDCSVAWSHEFPVINYDLQPHVLWSHDSQYAYMLGYSTADSTSEYLVVMKDPHLRRRTGVAGDPDIWLLRDEMDDLQSLDQNGLFAHPTNSYQLILVTDSTISMVQVYPAKYQVMKTIELAKSDNFLHYTDATLQNERLFLVGTWL